MKMERLVTFGKKNKLFVLLVCLELLVFLWLGRSLFVAPYEYDVTPQDFKQSLPYVSDVTITPDKSALIIEVTKADEYTAIQGDGLTAISPGHYLVTASYESISDVDHPSYSPNDSAGRCIFYSNVYFEGVEMNPLVMDDGHNEATTDMWIKDDTQIEDLICELQNDGHGRLTVYNVHVEENVGFRWVRMLRTLIVCLFINMCYWLFFYRPRKQNS